MDRSIVKVALRRMIAGAVIVLSGGLSACGGDRGLDALHGATHWRQVGMKVTHRADIVYGYVIATNDSGEPLTITDVELTDADGIAMPAVYLIVMRPSDDIESFGGWNYPPRIPAREADLRSMWGRRVVAVGAVMPAGEDLRMNFVLRLTGRPGARSGPLKVTYQDSDGRVGTWTSNIRYAIFQQR